MSIGRKARLTRACLICGEPVTGKLDYTVLVMGSWGNDTDHTWWCHGKCLREAAHPRFADYFAKPS